MATARVWADRVEAVLRAARADGIDWSYVPDYCEAINCAGCCQSYGPLMAERGRYRRWEPADSPNNRAHESAEVMIF